MQVLPIYLYCTNCRFNKKAMASMQATRLGIQHTCRPRGIVSCTACRRLQTSAWRRQKRLFRRNSDPRVRSSIDSAEFHQWTKLKDGVTITVSGLARGMTRYFRQELDAKTVTVSEGTNSLKMVRVSMANAVDKVQALSRSYTETDSNEIRKSKHSESNADIDAKESILVDNSPMRNKTDKALYANAQVDYKHDPNTITDADIEESMDKWIEQLLESQKDSVTLKCNTGIKSKFDINIEEIHTNGTQQNVIDEIIKTSDTKPVIPTGSSSSWRDSISYFARQKKAKTELVDENVPSEREASIINDNELEDINQNNSNAESVAEETLQPAQEKVSSSTLTNRLKESVAGFSVRKGGTTAPKEDSKPQEKNENSDKKDVKLNKKPTGEKVIKDKKGKLNAAEEERSYLDMIWKLPQNIGFGTAKEKEELEEQLAYSLVQGELMAESGLAESTKALSESLTHAHSIAAKKHSLHKMCAHLLKYPQFRHIVYEVSVEVFCNRHHD